MAAVPAKADSVFDFLYVDTRRIGQLLSQLGSDGVLTELERSSEITSQHGGGFDLKVAKADMKEGAKTNLRRRFDPQWLLPLTFLEAANEIIVRDPQKAGIGQLVLVSGGLSLIDMMMLKRMIDDPTISKIAIDANKQPAPAGPRQKAQQRQQPPDSTEVGMAMVRVLPHVVQARLDSSGLDFWASLDPEGLLTTPADLFLKHCLQIAGEWVLVGILDAVPESTESAVLAIVESIRASAKLGAYAAAIAQMVPTVRPLLGRPNEAYGITPLVIFREIVR